MTGSFCVSFVCQVLRAYKTLCQLRKKMREREQSASQKKVRKAKEKKTFDDARVEKTYSDDYSST